MVKYSRSLIVNVFFGLVLIVCISCSGSQRTTTINPRGASNAPITWHDVIATPDRAQDIPVSASKAIPELTNQYGIRIYPLDELGLPAPQFNNQIVTSVITNQQIKPSADIQRGGSNETDIAIEVKLARSLPQGVAYFYIGYDSNKVHPTSAERGNIAPTQAALMAILDIPASAAIAIVRLDGQKYIPAGKLFTINFALGKSNDRQIARAPIGPNNVVNLLASKSESGTVTLTWTELNTGDCDNNPGPNDYTKLEEAGYVDLSNRVESSSSVSFYLQITTPSINTATAEQQIDITILAEAIE